MLPTNLCTYVGLLQIVTLTLFIPHVLSADIDANVRKTHVIVTGGHVTFIGTRVTRTVTHTQTKAAFTAAAALRTHAPAFSTPPLMLAAFSFFLFLSFYSSTRSHPFLPPCPDTHSHESDRSTHTIVDFVCQVRLFSFLLYPSSHLQQLHSGILWVKHDSCTFLFAVSLIHLSA